MAELVLPWGAEKQRQLYELMQDKILRAAVEKMANVRIIIRG